MQRLSVLFSAPLSCFDYLSQEPIPVGTFVMAPFGRKMQMGVVWDKKSDVTLDEAKLKEISEILSLPPLPQETIDFVNWVAGYTLAPLGNVLKMVLHSEMTKTSKKPLIFGTPNKGHTTINFSDMQERGVELLCDTLNDGFSVSLLDGVTGSGKTEVYFEAIANALSEMSQILVLLPEITLTTPWLDRFEKRFGVKPALWHSSITPKQRRDTWNAIINNQAKVIVGARSALFLPFQNLKLIVIDEEHDASFKQEDGVLYHARDMGIVRAKIANCPIILASATPSIETYCNTLLGKYRHIELPNRFAGANFPDIRLVDMRTKEKRDVKYISLDLQAELANKLQKQEQSLLFINRRGYAPLVLCGQCGEKIKCPHCSAWLVEHRTKKMLQCHHCGYQRPRPVKCDVCEGENTFISCGPGVERICDEVSALFPTARLQIVTTDTMQNPAEFEHILQKIASNEIDILIGTQMLAKGHHFANLTLVGVIDGDMGLDGGDLRASERTFQLLHQVMGRAGREQKKGTAIIQTYAPENMIIQALKNNSRQEFLDAEVTSRQILNMPPFGKLASFIISGKDEQIVYSYARHIVKNAPFEAGIDVFGPTPAPIALLRGKYRYRILIKTNKEVNMQNLIRNWLCKTKKTHLVDLRVDIDPYSFF